MVPWQGAEVVGISLAEKYRMSLPASLRISPAASLKWEALPKAKTLECAFDIDRGRVVPFDEVAVVAAHRPHEISERGRQAIWKGTAETGALLRQFQRQIEQNHAEARDSAKKQRLHQTDGFTAVFDRFI